MAKILLAWELGAGAGHWANLQPIAERLAGEGHEIWAVLRNVEVVPAEVAAQIPVTILPAPRLTTPKAHKLIIRSFAQMLNNVGYHDARVLAAGISAWRNLYAIVQPDVILFEHSPTALLASRGLDARRAVIGTGFFSPPTVSPWPDLHVWGMQRATKEQLSEEEEKLLSRINTALTQHQLPTLDPLSALYTEIDENFLLTFPELDHFGPRAGQNYWGMWTSKSTFVPTWPSPLAEHKIFVYLLMAEWLPSLLQLLTLLDCSVVAYARDYNPKMLSDVESDKICFVKQPVSMSWLSEQCDLAITNANAGTVTSMLLQGIPSLNFPHHLESTLFAHRVREVGAGLTHLSKELNTIPNQLDYILGTQGFKDSAAQFAERYKKFDELRSLEGIVNKIVNLL